MTYRVLTAFVLMLTAACGTNNICVADDARAIDPLLIHDIEAAVAYWTDAGHDVRTVADGPGCDIRVRFGDESHLWAHPETAAHTDVAHHPFPVDRDVVLRASTWDAVVAEGNASVVVAHELGHQLIGVEHSDDPADLMYHTSHAANQGAVEAR